LTPAGPADPDFDLDQGTAPEEVRYIRDVETLKAISDPTRMRILETMVQRRSPAWSVKELAAALDVPQTRLYHHVELLAERDLVRPVERRVVSGIIETRYAVAALSFQLDRSLFSSDSPEGLAILGDTLAAVFDTARNELEQAIRAGAAEAGDTAPAERRLMVSRGLASLTPVRAAELRQRLQALSDEFGMDHADPSNAEDAQAYGIVLAVYPMPPNPEHPDA